MVAAGASCAMIGHRRVTHLKKGAVTYGAVSASKDWPDTSTWQILSGGEGFYECYAEWSADDDGMRAAVVESSILTYVTVLVLRVVALVESLSCQCTVASRQLRTPVRAENQNRPNGFISKTAVSSQNVGTHAAVRRVRRAAGSTRWRMPTAAPTLQPASPILPHPSGAPGCVRPAPKTHPYPHRLRARPPQRAADIVNG